MSYKSLLQGKLYPQQWEACWENICSLFVISTAEFPIHDFRIDT